MLASQSHKMLQTLMGKVKHYFINFYNYKEHWQNDDQFHIVHTYKVLVKSQDKRNEGVH